MTTLILINTFLARNERVLKRLFLTSKSTYNEKVFSYDFFR